MISWVKETRLSDMFSATFISFKNYRNLTYHMKFEIISFFWNNLIHHPLYIYTIPFVHIFLLWFRRTFPNVHVYKRSRERTFAVYFLRKYSFTWLYLSFWTKTTVHMNFPFRWMFGYLPKCLVNECFWK